MIDIYCSNSMHYVHLILTLEVEVELVISSDGASFFEWGGRRGEDIFMGASLYGCQ